MSFEIYLTIELKPSAELLAILETLITAESKTNTGNIQQVVPIINTSTKNGPAINQTSTPKKKTREMVEELLSAGFTKQSEIAKQIGVCSATVKYHIDNLNAEKYIKDHKNNSKQDKDLDKDFRPLISKYQNTKTDYDGGNAGIDG